MKKILAFILVFVVAASCTKLEDLNKNVKDPYTVTGESLFTGAQLNLFDQMVSTNVNRNIFRLITQYWTETTYIDESNYDLVTRSIPDNHWDALYRDVLKDFQESSRVISSTDYSVQDGDQGQTKTNRLAIVEIMSVYSWSVLVETFGNVPYSQAFNMEILHPKYDDGLTIYKDLIARLNVAIGKLNPSFGSFGTADNMYQGEVIKWQKFANSLKLKMGLIIADADGTLAKTTVEAAASAGVFTSNTDNGKIIYQQAQPNTNPIYDDLVASGRNDFVPTSHIIDTMNTLNDPRRPFYFTLHDTIYIGGENGNSNDYTQYSHVSDKIKSPTFEGTILDYSEVEFLLAEAVERGYNVGGTAASHYENGIRASITYWGGLDAQVTAYLVQPAVAYATATGDWKEKIGTQAWIALYNRGFEAWTEWRRLDYPILVAPPDANSDVPVRLTYPVEEQTLNAAQWAAGSAAIGGDDVGTKLFWDKH